MAKQNRQAQLGLASDRPYFEQFDPESVPSPCFVVDRAALQYNLDILQSVAKESGATLLIALKAFSMFSVFDQVGQALSGACASGPYEAQLGREFINKQVHTFAPAYSSEDIAELLQTSDHIVFNTLGQWQRFQSRCLKAQQEQGEQREAAGRHPLSFGIRVNPEHSEGTTPLYDPAGPFSRLGTPRGEFNAALGESIDLSQPDAAQLFQTGGPLYGISGVHMHTLCEQNSFALERTVTALIDRWGDLLKRPEITWLNLGGGHHITKPDYDQNHLIGILKGLREQFQVQLYLEPGEAVAIHTGILVTRVLDTLQNGMPLAILDTSATAHMPDTLEMPYRPEVWDAGLPGDRAMTYRLGGQTCLAGDVIGDYSFSSPLNPGDSVIFDDMAHYTMVKTTTFNGIRLPSLAVYDSRNGETKVVRSFSYEDFLHRLS